MSSIYFCYLLCKGCWLSFEQTLIHPGLCAKFGWTWTSAYGEKFSQKLIMYFQYFAYYHHVKGAYLSFVLYSKTFCVRFGWNRWLYIGVIKKSWRGGLRFPQFNFFTSLLSPLRNLSFIWTNFYHVHSMSKLE